jgi:threonine/homoserine/homoserine lactone efflux protein
VNTAAHPVATGTPAAPTRDADGMAVASFLLGLPGLLVLNLVLGPAAIVLALTALARGTRRRGRAVLGLALGVAGLAIQTALTIAGHGVLWSFS